MSVEGNEQQPDGAAPAQPQYAQVPPPPPPAAPANYPTAPSNYPAVPPPPPYPQYAQGYSQFPATYAVKPPTLGITVTSMCLGIAALTIGWLFAVLVPLLGIAAVVCGHVGLSQVKKSQRPVGGKGFAIAGLVTGYLAIATGIALAVFWFVLIAAFGVSAD
ncbi:DUF4190 domain-containing protein [Demequina oxidasica]|uniref:DUF4190 domain-containing protein n=1 Tax=Demequina oxidasica TaxID=676199 RepID=UPI0007811277|nr:DUF4190 domain-containing protein [Demequina oxidasica]